MQRAVIIAKGKVQKVGYRDYVQEIAIALGVVGYVENQLDGSVQIVGEAEKDILEDFIRKLKPEDDPLIMVDKIDIRYEEPTGEFKYFEIKRGSSDEESGERLDTAQKALKTLIKTTAGMNIDLGRRIDGGRDENKQGFKILADKQDKMLEKQDLTISEIRNGFGKMDQNFTKLGGKIDNVSNKLDSFHQDTVHRFDNLDVKYGRIADNMEKILKEMKEERKDFRESIEKILKILISQKSKS